MTIASHVFLLIFLPLAAFAYYGLFRRPRLKMFFLLFASYAFYALADWKFLPLLLALSFFTFLLARRGWIGAGVALNLGALALFKYLNFGIEGYNAAMTALGLSAAVAKALELGLPLGISFYVFKHIGYLLDVQRGRIPATSDFWAFATFSAYFPQISAGPISGFQETAEQYASLPDRPRHDQIYSGLLYLSMGLTKKVLIADSLGTLLASSTNSVDGFAGAIPAWYIVLAYTMQLYFDFSGYTDMVLGVSMIFGVTLPPNFNSPYLATNPAEFWERWHMSLSNWFNYYLFSPMSRSLLRKWGAQKRDQAQYVANLATMSLVGLWHGAGLSYIFWGLYHGLLLNFNAWWKRRNINIPTWIGRPIFLFSILLGWAFFMSPDSEYLIHLFKQLFGLGGLGDTALMLELAQNFATPALVVALLLTATGLSEASSVFNAGQYRVWYAVLWGVLAALSLFLLGGQIQFLYVQF
ncbi:MAG: MBOAT family protein [Chloroflexi bacterium]|nr:MBOAT family protein [Chloroflexota bacterium]